MRLLTKLSVFLCILPLSVLSQERITKVMSGNYNNGIRIVAAFIEPSGKTFKTQSMIIDLDSIKSNSEQPDSVSVDLTSTVRNLTTGEKKQKILQLRWKKSGEIEFRCDGKWVKKDSDTGTEKIIEAVKAIIRVIPLKSKDTTELTLKSDVEQKIIAVLNSLDTEKFTCLRSLN